MKLITSKYVSQFLGLNNKVIHIDCFDNLKENWRCDDMKIGFMVITNEFSLYTRFVKYEYMMDVPDIIGNLLISKIDNDAISIFPYYYSNKRITGSMNNIKQMVSGRDFWQEDLGNIEKFINQTTFTYLENKRPVNLHFI